MSGRTIPIANLQRSAASSLTCHGCKHCLYTAPGGQQWATHPTAPEILRKPHSRCTALAAYVPMVLGDHDKWLGSEVPPGCPQHRQPELF